MFATGIFYLNQKTTYRNIIRHIAQDLGFMSCGIARAGFLEAEAPRLERWLNENRQGEMQYMANHFDKRVDPTLLVAGAKSVVSLLFNYYPPEQQNPSTYKIAKYAYGEDYHFIIKEKLKLFLERIREEIGEVHGRVFVDSAPVLEKAWAAKSGLGWIGKNTNLITKKTGSFYFIAELILDLEIEPDAPTTDHCGSCTACIDACPTDALQPYQIDASKCISYATIELKDAIPDDFSNTMQDWMFGCDICQDVCPWNRFSKPHSEPRLLPNQEKLSFTKNDWQELTQELFSEIFRKSAVKRTKYAGLMRNIRKIEES